MDEEKKEVEVVNTEVEKKETVVEEQKGFSIASMVLGILSIVMICYWPLSIICSILAIIFGVIGRKKAGKGMATAGLVLGILAICLWLLIFLFVAVLGAAVLVEMPELLEEMTGVINQLDTLNTVMY